MRSTPRNTKRFLPGSAKPAEQALSATNPSHTYHATAADVESEQTLLTKAPAHPWKRLAAGAAVASFVLGTPAPAPSPSTNTCNKPCTSNRDCATGGYLECGQCNLVTGTLGFGTCMAAPTSPPTDAPPNPCGKPCTEDKECNGNGGFFGNTCLVGGTRCAGHCAKRD